MAKLIEQAVTITVSKMVSNSDYTGNKALLDEEMLANLEVVIKELVGSDCMVEIEDVK